MPDPLDVWMAQTHVRHPRGEDVTERKSQDAEYFVCPHCGAEVPAAASFCRHCGASEESGWNESEADLYDHNAGYADDDDFDYNEFITREFADRTSQSTSHKVTRWLMGIVVAVVCISLLVWTILLTN